MEKILVLKHNSAISTQGGHTVGLVTCDEQGQYWLVLECFKARSRSVCGGVRKLPLLPEQVAIWQKEESLFRREEVAAA